jgi:peptidoglycan/xylan/chitin deacetylase (PgdA/CDA1 family)
MGKKEFLANLFYYSGLIYPASRLERNRIVILNYHRIRTPEVPGDSLLDEGVFGPTQSEFERQVKWLKQNFDLLSESELLNMVRKSDTHPGRYAAITFDDGYRDNYDLAYPVLSAHAAPAIFFVCPGIIESRRLGWWDVIAYLVKKSEKEAITVKGDTLPLGSQKCTTISKLDDWMKRRKRVETKNLLEELAVACGVSFPDGALQDAQLMTWPQVREVSANGVAIGSHTKWHPVLATLSEDEQREELVTSKAELEQQLGCPVRTLAYPVGGYQHFTPATMRIARECGYEGAFSFQTGGNSAGHINPYNIHRMACSAQFDPLFVCGTVMPKIFTWSRPLPESHRAVS